MSRAKNKTRKMPSPLTSDSDSSSDWENNELPNHLKNIIDKPKTKKNILSDQFHPIKFRPSIAQRALRKNFGSSTPSSKNCVPLFFPSDSSYSPIDCNNVNQQKKNSFNSIPPSNNSKNEQDESIAHVSRSRSRRNGREISKINNNSVGCKIESICRRLSETKRDDIYENKSLRKSLKENLTNSKCSDLNSTLIKKRVGAGTQRISQNEDDTDGNEVVKETSKKPNNTLLLSKNKSDLNENKIVRKTYKKSKNTLLAKNKSDLNEDKKSSSELRNTEDDIDKIEETLKNPRNTKNVTLRKSNEIKKVVKPISIQIIDDSNDDSDGENINIKKKNYDNEKVSKIPVLRSRSKSVEKCNKTAKNSSNKKMLPVENEDLDENSETSSCLAKNDQRFSNFMEKIQRSDEINNNSERTQSSSFSDVTKYISMNKVNPLFESLDAGSVVDRFSSGYNHNVLDKDGTVQPWRYSVSDSRIELVNKINAPLSAKLPEFKSVLYRKSIKHYARNFSSVIPRSPSTSSKISDRSSVEVFSNEKNKPSDETKSDKIKKWLNDIPSKVASPEQSSSNDLTEVNTEKQEQSKKSIKQKQKKTKKNRKSLRVCLENKFLDSTNVTSTIKKSQNEQMDETIENNKKSKKSVKNIKPVTRLSLRVCLKRNNTLKLQKKNKIDSEINVDNCEINKDHHKEIEKNNDAVEDNNELIEENNEAIEENNEAIEENNELIEENNERSKIVVEKEKSLCMSLKKPLTLEEPITLQDDELSETPMKKAKRQSSPKRAKRQSSPKRANRQSSPKIKTTNKGKSKKSSQPVQDESVNIVSTGRPVRNRRPPPLGIYDVIGIVDKKDARLWMIKKDLSPIKENSSILTKHFKTNGSSKKNSSKSKKNESSTLSKKTKTLNKTVSKKKSLATGTTNGRKTRKQNSTIVENSCNFPEGAINRSEGNCAASDTYEHPCNNDYPNLNGIKENQLLIEGPRTRITESSDRDSGTGTVTMTESNCSKKLKNSVLTTGSQITTKHNKSRNHRNSKYKRISTRSSADQCSGSSQIPNPLLEDQYSGSSRLSNPPLHDEYIDVTTSDGTSKLKFVENNATFTEMTDSLIYSDGLNNASGTSLIYLQIPPGKYKSLHMNRKHEVNYFVIEGKGRIVVNDKISPIQTLSRVVLPRGCRYTIRNDSITEKMLLACFRGQST